MSHFERDQNGDALEASQERLFLITSRLNRLGLMSLFATVTNVVMTVLSLTSIPYMRDDFELQDLVGPLVFLDALVALTAVVLLTLFDVLRRRGDTVYEALSDEVEHLLSRRSASGQPTSFRVPLYLRLTMRGYASATQLPLVPGRSGPAVLAGLNLLLLLLVPATSF